MLQKMSLSLFTHPTNPKKFKRDNVVPPLYNFPLSLSFRCSTVIPVLLLLNQPALMFPRQHLHS